MKIVRVPAPEASWEKLPTETRLVLAWLGLVKTDLHSGQCQAHPSAPARLRRMAREIRGGVPRGRGGRDRRVRAARDEREARRPRRGQARVEADAEASEEVQGGLILPKVNKPTTNYVYPPMRLPLVTAALVAANLATFGLELADGVVPTCEAYGLVPAHVTAGGLLGSLFLHVSWVHLGGNVVCLAFAGPLIERTLGHLRFLTLYLVAGALGGLLHAAIDPTTMVGASGAICGVLAVLGAIRPRLLGFVVGFMLVNVWYALVGGGEGISFGTHIGGFAVGVLAVALARASGSEALEAT